jgi:large subunit ribosomal protein L31
MKQGIHPAAELQTIHCVCGASYEIRSTKKLSKLDICASCHPYFTGKQKYVDTAGRVEKFKKRYGGFAKP